MDQVSLEDPDFDWPYLKSGVKFMLLRSRVETIHKSRAMQFAPISLLRKLVVCTFPVPSTEVFNLDEVLRKT